MHFDKAGESRPFFYPIDPFARPAVGHGNIGAGGPPVCTLNPGPRIMSNLLILVLAATILWTYLVELTSSRLHLPAVIPLVLTGLGINALLPVFGTELRWVDRMLPILGSIGLVLIVLEGALDLDLRRQKRGLILRSAALALIGILFCTATFGWLAMQFFGLDSFVALAIAIPFAVISSAVAIPSARSLSPRAREFVVYESSISDIIGVLVFFAWLASGGDRHQFLRGLLGGGALSVLISLLLSGILFMVVNHIRGHVRFIPILAGLFLLYTLGKQFHLSTLLLILFFGLLLNNAGMLRRVPRLNAWMVENYEASVLEFKSIVAEVTFAVRGVFFVLLGVWTPLGALADWKSWLTAVVATALIFAIRRLSLWLLRVDDRPALLWLAPRGLITVLLILSAAEQVNLNPFPPGAVMLTVLLTCTAVLMARPHRHIEPIIAATGAPPSPDAPGDVAQALSIAPTQADTRSSADGTEPNG